MSINQIRRIRYANTGTRVKQCLKLYTKYIYSHLWTLVCSYVNFEKTFERIVVWFGRNGNRGFKRNAKVPVYALRIQFPEFCGAVTPREESRFGWLLQIVDIVPGLPQT